MKNKILTIKSLIKRRISLAKKGKVWTPIDFIDIGARDVIDKTLQRMVHSNELRRIDRGLYDQPKINSLTGKKNAPDYRKVLEAIVRRDQIRVLVDGLTCANELGLTNAVIGQVIIHTDARLRPIKLDKLTIKFKLTAPSKLYWAGRPGMKIIQALYWLHDSFEGMSEIDKRNVQYKLIRFLQNSKHGKEICNDLEKGLYTIPVWMQKYVRELLTRL